jgi:hypothetical protein
VTILNIPVFSPKNVGWGWVMVWLIKENNQLQSGTPETHSWLWKYLKTLLLDWEPLRERHRLAWNFCTSRLDPSRRIGRPPYGPDLGTDRSKRRLGRKWCAASRTWKFIGFNSVEKIGYSGREKKQIKKCLPNNNIVWMQTTMDTNI